MLKRLIVQNFALIAHAELEFNTGFTVITGETGAGKSIFLGALQLINGARAEQRFVGSKADKCVVEAYFELDNTLDAAFFETNNFDLEQICCVRREIYKTGKSRAFINDVPASLAQIKQFTESKLDIGSQFETFSLADPAFLLQIIDAICQNNLLLAEYAAHYKAWKAAEKQLIDLEAEQAIMLKEKDFKQFLFEELEAAMPFSETEQVNLEAELNQLQHADAILMQLNKLQQLFETGEMSIMDGLSVAKAACNQLAKILPAANQFSENLQHISSQLHDLSYEISLIASNTKPNPERMQFIDNRLSTLYKLQQKHRVKSNDALAAVYDALQTDLTKHNQLDEALLNCQKLVKQTAEIALKKAEMLSKRRVEMLDGLMQKINLLLSEVGLEQAKLELVLLQSETLKQAPFGKNMPELRFASSKNAPLLPVNQVASGGERSRILLCIKTVAAQFLQTNTILFDEIDSGISGTVTLQVAKLLKQLSTRTQLMAITHQAAIAAAADMHWVVEKKQSDTDALSTIRTLTQEERIITLAALMQGDKPTEAGIQSAKDLIAMVNA